MEERTENSGGGGGGGEGTETACSCGRCSPCSVFPPSRFTLTLTLALLKL